MNPEHREKIDAIMDVLVCEVNMTALWPLLFLNRIYDDEYYKILYWELNITKSEIIKDIFLDIKTRGPHAYHYLILSLRQMNQHFFADLLE